MLGRSLGNYGVVSKIGEGGMGVVYLAQHITLGRKAAVKVLHPAMSSNQEIVGRFFNEARAATAIRNPGIVEVYDFGFLEDGTAYIIMEYLEGENLAARIRRGRSTIAMTLTIVRAIARALQAAHEQGVIHRDLKPENVFLTADSELPTGERVKLLDFGIAKLAYDVGGGSHTATGAVMGTPMYMSPEQCRNAGSVDHRADLYSLGCVAYEMLCGQPPFIANGTGELIAHHLYFEPSPLRRHHPEIPAELEDLVLRLLQKQPRARYSRAVDVIRAIDELAALIPHVTVRDDWTASDLAPTLPAMEATTLHDASSSNVASRDQTKRSGSRIAMTAMTASITILVVLLADRLLAGEQRSTTASVCIGGGLILTMISAMVVLRRLRYSTNRRKEPIEMPGLGHAGAARQAVEHHHVDSSKGKNSIYELAREQLLIRERRLTNILRYSLAIVIVLALFETCAMWKSDRPVLDSVTMAGVVVDEDDAPIVAAAITVEGRDFLAESDENGTFQGRLTRVTPGEILSVQISKSGFRRTIHTVTVHDGALNMSRITLRH